MEEQSLTHQLQQLAEDLYMLKQVFTVEDLAKYTGYSKSFIYKAAAKRIIPHSSPRYGRLFFSREAINEWLMSNPIPTERDLERAAANFLLNK